MAVLVPKVDRVFLRKVYDKFHHFDADVGSSDLIHLEK
jgi:hypothetical protein